MRAEVATQNRLTLKAYLQLEEETKEKYEYFAGYVYAMAGGSYAHNTICGNIFSEINMRLKGTSCQIMNSDTKLYLQPRESYVYPDAMILCGTKEESPELKGAFMNPVVIIEVLSDSTEGFDRGEKFEYYRQIPSLKHYLMIRQDVVKIDIYSREDTLWRIETLTGLKNVMELEVVTDLKLNLPLADIYDRISFETK
ncbi:MAG: Uma2 family endonuclease [Bernardetiaceae bacterium]